MEVETDLKWPLCMVLREIHIAMLVLFHSSLGKACTSAISLVLYGFNCDMVIKAQNLVQ